MDIIETIKEQIANNTVLLYMKGSPNAPQCGFSSKAAQVVMACGEKFAYVDILQNPEIRANLPKYANWPTFPQLWVGGELVGGSDILAEMFDKGELQTLIKDAVQKASAKFGCAINKKPRQVRGFLFMAQWFALIRPSATAGSFADLRLRSGLVGFPASRCGLLPSREFLDRKS